MLIKENDAITSRLLTLDRDLLMIPSVAIHMNREVNDKASYNKQVDMLPLLGGAAEEGDRKSTRLNSSHSDRSRMPSSA